MGYLLSLLSVPLFVILYISFWVWLFIKAYHKRNPVGVRFNEVSKGQIEIDKKRKQWLRRREVAEMIKEMLSNDVDGGLYRDMLSAEVELTALIKPMKQRLISDRRYAQITEANQAGDFKRVIELSFGIKK